MTILPIYPCATQLCSQLVRVVGLLAYLRPPEGEVSSHLLRSRTKILIRFLLAQKITQVEWYASMLFENPDQFNYILCCTTLLQEVVEDLYFCVERNRLDYFKKNQGKIKAQVYQGVREALRNSADPQGLKVILPSSFVGSPRHMIQLYQDSMAIVEQYSKPSLFITMTANPQWKDVTKALPPGFSASDRPDLVCRIFQLQKEELLVDLTQKHVLGRVLAHVSVIEFQKRGLPHCHIMLFLHPANVPRTPNSIDCLVSAKIPDPQKEPDLFRLVGQTMIHGPCTRARCLVDGICSKQFPKPYQPQTDLPEDSYPLYRRRKLDHVITKGGQSFDNQFVVPYNKLLLLKYQCHINVEIPYGINATKYLFQYICKGIDRSALELKKGDEIAKFVHGRYIGPCEGECSLSKSYNQN